ncbi:relaxase/mobilization nuclease domain-containing protein [Myxosarcina sp. GI1]|uniref:relaxase/mobilization nuclease domain-containing protein n=1 Tax=Myxosarcina sp. GI1 TaxID=1541065 RepID=UPI000689C3AB|nr:relaxase/mobilization nuclease domain-containing protein [Myxosarcina sp. GI1]
MIGNISTGSDFRGLVDYLLDPSKTPQIVDTNLAGGDRNTMTWELDTCASQRLSTKKPVKHISIGFAPNDGRLNSKTIEEIAIAIINGLGYDNNQYLVVRHGRVDPKHDRAHEHDHFHILINAIDFEGKRVVDSYDKKKLENILRQQEIEHNLTIVADSEQRKYKASTTGQVQRMMREIEEYRSGARTERSVVTHAMKIQSGIDLASRDRPNLSVFLARLQQLQIDPKLRVEEGKITGISYRLQDFKIRGCKLHQASYLQLLEHRVTYEPQKDMLAVRKANRNEIIGLEPQLEVSWNQVEIENYVPSQIKQLLEVASKQQEIDTVRTSAVLEHNKTNKEFEIEF